MTSALPPSLRHHAAERVPRYTSYPTAPCFTPAVDESQARAWLGTLDSPTTASIYLHVPFCHALCWYCGCHTKIPAGGAAIVRYLDYMDRRIRRYTRSGWH